MLRATFLHQTYPCVPGTGLELITLSCKADVLNHYTTALLFNTRNKTCNLEGCNLEGCNLKGRNLEGRILEGRNLEGCSLEGCILEGCNLEGCNLEGCNLE